MMLPMQPSQAATASPPSFWRLLWDNLRSFDTTKVDAWVAARNTIGIFLCVCFGMAAGSLKHALALALGALMASGSDKSDPYPIRARRMVASNLLCAATFPLAALLPADQLWPAVFVTVAAFGAGMVVVLGSTAADLAVLTLVNLIVAAGHPLAMDDALMYALLLLLGGLIQTALSLAPWPLRRYAPERRAIADVFDALAHSATAADATAHMPPINWQASQSQQIVTAVQRNLDPQMERYRSLLSQAERVRLALLAVSQLRTPWATQPQSAPRLAILDRFLEHTSVGLAHIAQTLLRANHAAPRLPVIEPMEQCLAEWTNAPTPPDAETEAGCIQQLKWQMGGLVGKLRTCYDLAINQSPQGRIALAQADYARPIKLRFYSYAATLRANLRLDSAGLPPRRASGGMRGRRGMAQPPRFNRARLLGPHDRCGRSEAGIRRHHRTVFIAHRRHPGGSAVCYRSVSCHARYGGCQGNADAGDHVFYALGGFG